MNTEREEQLKRAAHAIWESEGRPDGADADHWRRAEEELGPETYSDESQGDNQAGPRAMQEAARQHGDTYLVATDLEDDDQRTSSAGTREQP